MIQVKFNDKAKQVLSDTLDLSGSVVVTELPKVGEEHTIYELQETKVADFPWLLTEIDDDRSYATPNLPLIVVENEEDVTYENLKIRSMKSGAPVGVYVKATNKVYSCSWEEAEIDEQGDPDYTFIKVEVTPRDNTYSIEKTKFVILKDFDYLSDSSGESIVLYGTGHFLDGTEFDYGEYEDYDIVPLVLTDATNKQFLLDDNLFGYDEFTSETQVKHPVQVNKIDLSIITDIIDEGGEPIFAPQPSGTISTYWIYTDGEWLNIDDIGTPNTITLPIESVTDGGVGIIPLSKVHFYLENKELDLVTIDSSDGDKERGYLVVPLLDTDDATYSLHIVFDNDVIFGSDCNLRNEPIFVIMEDTPYINIKSSSREYDLTIYVGTLRLFNGMLN